MEQSCILGDRRELELAEAWAGSGGVVVAVTGGCALPKSLAEGKKVGLTFSPLSTSQEVKLCTVEWGCDSSEDGTPYSK